jgi:hypothetical protein
MNKYIRLQYEMYKKGSKSIGIEKVKKLAEKYMTKEERAELFEGGDTNGK